MNLTAERRNLENRAGPEIAMGDYDTAWRTLDRAAACISKGWALELVNDYNRAFLMLVAGSTTDALARLRKVERDACEARNFLVAADCVGLRALAQIRLGDMRGLEEAAKDLSALPDQAELVMPNQHCRVAKAWFEAVMAEKPIEAIESLRAFRDSCRQLDIDRWLAVWLELVLLEDACGNDTQTQRRDLQTAAAAFGALAYANRAATYQLDAANPIRQKLLVLRSA